jgi:Tfp pilus assembly protein FimT
VGHRLEKRRIRARRAEGFTILELVLVMAGALTVAAIAAPSFSTFIDSNRSATAARLVERELQTARLKAVSSGRSLRLRLNCPAAGRVRLVEVTGVAATDNASNRCDPVAFPSPGPRDALRATPSLDSPVVYLPDGATVSSPVTIFELDPRGSVYSVGADGLITPLAGDVVLTIARDGWTNTVRINALGRIRLD